MLASVASAGTSRRRNISGGLSVRSGRIMALKFFTVPVRDAATVEAELNAFLSSRRVLVVERRFVDLGENSFWSLCVDYLPAQPGAQGPSFGKKGRVDYREILPP